MRAKNAFLRVLGAFVFATVVALVAGCGGGGGSSGGSSSSSSNGPSSSTANQVTVTVDKGLQNVPNLATVSVTVCQPGTSTCQTIDHIQVDTMSYGLRLVSSSASQVLSNLPVVTDSIGNTIAECTVFADGYTWGSVRTADVKIGGETASGVPIGILGDVSAAAPSSCTNNVPGGAENTVAALGVNGILGIGVTPYDCGSGCVSNANNGFYYSCTSSSCTGTTLALANQVTNPVAKFGTDNNGVILAMPAVGSTGSSSVSGTLTFGIGTQSNNALSSTAAQQFTTSAFGDLNSTTFSGSGSGLAFFDSGSNAYFFTDSTLGAQTCSSSAAFYCPASTTSRSVTVSSFSGTSPSTTVTMSIANAQTLFNSGNFAFNDLAGPFGLSSIIDVGLPFFYGRTVYFGYDRRPLGGTQTPYVAF